MPEHIILENSFLKGVLNNSPVAYLVMDKDFKVVYANQYLAKIAGVTQEDVLGKKCYEARGHTQTCSECVVMKAFQSHQKEYRMNRELDRFGRVRYNDNYAVPLFNADGSVDYVMEILADRTEEIGYQRRLSDDFYCMIDAFSEVVEAKDQYTANHSRGVRDMSMLVAERMGLSEREKHDIYVAASLHDIGKVGVPDAIINKPGKLDSEEFNVIKRHPEIGKQILSRLTDFESVRQIILHHHERWDGKGYPDGLTGEEIPLGSRIVCVADSYDAMTSNRPYRQSMGHSAAARELMNGSGSQFDPAALDAFLDICAVKMTGDNPDDALTAYINGCQDQIVLGDNPRVMHREPAERNTNADRED
ncbi:MAG: HD domain-containing protein [Clostridiales bacterium]|jgi:PAS domain S-box-containing protein|nr:HD domain-containing protein [Clostridiales bacterium]